MLWFLVLGVSTSLGRTLFSPARPTFFIMPLPIVSKEFNHILRILNTNVDGAANVMYAITKIFGIGRRFSNIVLKKAEIDLKQRCVVADLFVVCVCFSLRVSTTRSVMAGGQWNIGQYCKAESSVRLSPRRHLFCSLPYAA